MGQAEQQEQLSFIVNRFAEIAPAGWVRLVGNWEAFRNEVGVLTLNYLTLAVINGGDRWQFGQVGYDETLYDAVVVLNDLAGADVPEHRWTVLDLEVDADRQFQVSFGYDPPKRARGVHDEESYGRFNSYLDTWVAEHGARPGR